MLAVGTTYVILLAWLLVFNSALPTELSKLDWNTIASIIFADIPVGLVLWFLLERTQSANRKLLDTVERVRAPTLFSNLEIHYSDEWENGEYPYLHYYVVNTKTKVAYQVTDELQDLIEERVIRKQPKYRDLAELTRYFEANKIILASAKPEGDDLFR